MDLPSISIILKPGVGQGAGGLKGKANSRFLKNDPCHLTSEEAGAVTTWVALRRAVYSTGKQWHSLGESNDHP